MSAKTRSDDGVRAISNGDAVLVTTAAVARFLAVDESTVRLWEERGVLPSRRFHGTGERPTVRFWAPDILAFVANAAVPSR